MTSRVRVGDDPRSRRALGGGSRVRAGTELGIPESRCEQVGARVESLVDDLRFGMGGAATLPL